MREPKEFDYFKAWLLFFLIATVGGGIVGLIIGGFGAAFLGAGGMADAQTTRVLQIVGAVIALWSASICFRKSRRMNRQRPNYAARIDCNMASNCRAKRL
jgi:hypothetical protein